MMYKLLATIIAISAEEVISAGKAVGTANNQVILGMLVVALIIVVGYREWQQVRASREATRRHDDFIKTTDERHEDLISRLDKERSSWEDERRARIGMLMTLVQDNTRAMEKSASSQSSVAEAVNVNSTAVNSLRDLIHSLPIRKR